MTKPIGQVQRGRDKLRGVSPAQEEFGTDQEEEEEESLLFDGEDGR